MNKYKEIKTLGKGSFGRAVLVQEISTGNKYVIKIIQVSAMKPNEREEAVQEAKILEKLQHPNITGYKESFTDSKFLYIVMEYANGGDLHDLIKKQKMQGKLFDEETIWNYFLQVCLAVKHIHDRRILHRDLKTQNIFISLDPQTGQKMMKIGDFGVSKVLSSTMECARTAIGTPYYLSPELCNNQGYNNKSDIWALGCILYELCTLNHTFEAANMKMLVVKILEGRYQEISPKYSKQLKDVVAMMLKKDPKARPNINTLLKQPFIVNKIKQQLTYIEQTVLEDEFSHTMFHGKGNLLKGFSQVSTRPESAAQNPFSQNKGKEAETPDTRSKDSVSSVLHGGFSNYPAAKKEPTPPRDAAMGFRNYPSANVGNVGGAAPPVRPAGSVHPISQAQQNNILAQAKQKQELIRQERQKAEQLIISQAKAAPKPSYPSNVSRRPGSGASYGQAAAKPAAKVQNPGEVVQGFCKYPSTAQAGAQQPQQHAPQPIYPKNTSAKPENHVPSAETLAGKFAALDNIYNAQQGAGPVAQPFKAPVAVPSAPEAQQMPFQAPAPTAGAIGGLFAYNPPNIQAPDEPSEQGGAAQRAHQAEVRRQLAPMSDKDKVRYQREKELQERRQKAQQLQKEHQEKLAAQQRQRQEKYLQLNKKYEQDMAARREKAAREEQKLQNEEAAKKQSKEEEIKKQELINKEKQAQMDQKVEELRRKNEAELARRREFIARKKEEAKSHGAANGDFRVEIAGAAPETADEAKEMGPTDVQTPEKPEEPKKAPTEPSKDSEDPQIDPVSGENSSSDFGDQPDAAMAEANDKAYGREDAAAAWQKRLKDPNSSESLCYRVESLRCYMEKEIGLDKFLEVYGALSDAAAEDKEDYDHGIVASALGTERMGMLNVIVQLILVEEQLNQQT